MTKTDRITLKITPERREELREWIDSLSILEFVAFHRKSPMGNDVFVDKELSNYWVDKLIKFKAQASYPGISKMVSWDRDDNKYVPTPPGGYHGQEKT